MKEENQELPVEGGLPVTDEKKPEPERFNRVQENLIYLMNKHKVSLADVCRETMIPMTTAWCWYVGETKAPLADINLVELARYFNVTVDWLILNDVYE